MLEGNGVAAGSQVGPETHPGHRSIISHAKTEYNPVGHSDKIMRSHWGNLKVTSGKSTGRPAATVVVHMPTI